jgi:hypothetical protein
MRRTICGSKYSARGAPLSRAVLCRNLALVRLNARRPRAAWHGFEDLAFRLRWWNAGKYLIGKREVSLTTVIWAAGACEDRHISHLKSNSPCEVSSNEQNLANH